jgi:non-specific protein-tyrosine kinase
MVKIRKKPVEDEIQAVADEIRTELEDVQEEKQKRDKVARIKLPEKSEDHLPAVSKKDAHLPMLFLDGISREHKEKIGWVSPHYHTSRPVTLDVELVHENRCTALLPESAGNDHYRVLRSHILRHTGREGAVTVMVTSALPREGKTLTAINLAATFAQEFSQTALLVDCDLKQQSIHETLGYQSDKGLSDHFLDDCPVAELTVWPGVEKLTIISGGRRIGSGSALLGSPRMKSLVEDLKGRYPERYVFLDAPPLLSGADALALIPLVDYVLVVAQAGKTSVDDVKKAVGLIPQEKVLGVVLNRERGKGKC